MTTPNLSQESQDLINQDFLDNFKKSIKSRDRWNALTRTLDVMTHILSASTVILAFISGIVATPVIAIIAGGTGTAMLVANQYSNYCLNQYKNQTIIIEEYSKKANVNDVLIDESPQMESDIEQNTAQSATPAPANTPVQNATSPV